MIRRPIAGVPVLVLMLWVGVGTAEAQWYRGWLDRLSGPGEFDGQGVFLEFLCYGVKRLPSPRQGQTTGQPDQGLPSASVSRELFVTIDCGSADQMKWRAVFGVDVAWYSTDRNPLTYAGDPSSDLREVRLQTLMATVDLVPHAGVDHHALLRALSRAFEVGAGVGVAWFDGDLFGTTSKLMLQPVRVTLKPLALFGEHRALGILQLRGVGTVFPGGFDAADFGAIPGSWRAGTEFLPTFQVVLDFGSLLGR